MQRRQNGRANQLHDKLDVRQRKLSPVRPAESERSHEGARIGSKEDPPCSVPRASKANLESVQRDRSA